MYEVILNKHTARTMGRMAPKINDRIFKALEGLRDESLRGKKLHGELAGLLSLRLGLWRIIYEVDHDQRLIIVHGIGPRGDIYNK